LRSQLQAEKTRYKELEEEHEDVDKWWRESKAKVTALEAEKSDLQKTCDELRSELKTQRADREKLQKEFDELNKPYLNGVFVAEAVEQNEKSATARELPEAAKIYNQFKAERRKSTTTLADVEKILEILEGG
jgi:hypothetical protein